MYNNDHLYDIYNLSAEQFSCMLNGYLQIIIAIIVTAFTIGISAVLYWVFCMPFIRIRDYHQVGYEYLRNESKKRNMKHRELVNRVRSLKRIESLPPIYPNGWFAIVERKEVPNGTVKSVFAIGQHFAVFRTNKGEVYILDGYCPHLGADLAVGGRVIGNCLECPFHGWQFDGNNGQCTHIPYADKIPQFAEVKKWTGIERLGWIFVWYHADNEEPDWYPEEVEEIINREFRFHGRIEYIVNAHIQDIAENAADLCHLSQVHGPAMLAGNNLEKAHSSFWNFFEHIYSDAYWKEEKMSHIATSGGNQFLRFFGKVNVCKVQFKHSQIGPGIVHIKLDTPFGTALLIQTQCPIGPIKIRLVTNIYCSKYMPAPVCKLLIYTNLNTIDRDVEIWNSKTYLTKPMLLKEDHLILRHRRYYQQFYSNNSPKMTFANNNTEW